MITREARDTGGEVHDRMPTFLTEDALEDVSSAVAEQLVTRPVDRQVNNVRGLDRSDPSLVKEV